MKKYFLLVLLGFFLMSAASAQTTTRTYHTPNKIQNKTVASITSGPVMTDTLANLSDLVSVLFGPGISVTNLTLTGANQSVGTFTAPAGSIGIDSGLVMASGSVFNIPGPNVSSSITSQFMTPGDTDLNNLIPGYPTFDASVIEFDFTPLTDTLIAADIVFGSEEYPEFVGVNFNDIFAFFISGPGFNGLENLAVIDTLNTPIAINNINASLNSQYYIDNTGGAFLEYDGYTTPFTLMHPIQINQTYHFKIAIADAGDGAFDSGVFLKEGSFLGYAKMPIANFGTTISGNTISFDNQTDYAKKYTWDFGDGTIDSVNINASHTYNSTGTFTVKLEARNYYQTSTSFRTVTITSAGINVVSPEPTFSIANQGDGSYLLKLDNTSGKPVLVNIYSISGVLVYSKTLGINVHEQLIDLYNAAKGIYTLQLIAGDKIVSKKLVK